VSVLLEVKGLSKRFPTDQRRKGRRLEVHAVSDVDLDIRRGEVVGLVGESGSGKTTLGRLILRLIEPSAGRIRFDGVEMSNLGGSAMRALRRRMQIVFQDPFSSLNPHLRVGEAIAEPIGIHGLASGAALTRRVDALLDMVGLPRTACDRFPHEFSGGQRQRIAIARALASEPDFVVADEAVAALDVSIQAQILNLLADLRAELGLTMLFISHDLGVVRHIADRVAVMYLGRVVEVGDAVQTMREPRHPYTCALVEAAPSLEFRKRRRPPPLAGDPPSPLEPPFGCAFAGRCAVAEDSCLRERPQLLPVAGSRVACFRFGHLSEGDAKESESAA
jgi:oligopeptide/dipeptide ABC transporter ATP-binding protein